MICAGKKTHQDESECHLTVGWIVRKPSLRWWHLGCYLNNQQEPTTKHSSKREQQTQSPKLGISSVNLSNRKKVGWLEFGEQEGKEGDTIREMGQGTIMKAFWLWSQV